MLYAEVRRGADKGIIRNQAMDGVEPLPSYAALVYTDIRMVIPVREAVYLAPYPRDDNGVILERWVPR